MSFHSVQGGPVDTAGQSIGNSACQGSVLMLSPVCSVTKDKWEPFSHPQFPHLPLISGTPLRLNLPWFSKTLKLK